LILALSSCAKTTQPVEIVTEPVKIAITAPADPNPLVLNNITWKVINNNDIIYYGITVSDYEQLALNMLEIKRYIKSQKNIIRYYEQATAN
jgi:hypothetical protein